MLTKLIQIQRRDGLTDAAMAARLGMSRSMWTLVRGERYALSADAAITAAGVWPELMSELFDMAQDRGKASREAVA